MELGRRLLSVPEPAPEPASESISESVSESASRPHAHYDSGADRKPADRWPGRR